MVYQIEHKLPEQIHRFSGELCTRFGKVTSRLVEQRIYAISANSSVLLTRIAAQTIDAITGELKKGGRIALPGFGTFSVGNRKARAGRNPRTGEEIRIPATKTAKFRPGKVLKEAVR